MVGGRTKTIRAGLLAVLAVLLLPAATAQAARTPIRIGDTPVGQVLTNAAGYVLFMFPREENSLTVCIRIRSCMRDWPPVTTTGPPLAGRGVDTNLLGTEPYRGKLREVTYAGWPLHTYRFSFSARNSVLNIGVRQFGDQWDALDPAGGFVTGPQGL
jgi:predicted lipoprotein with Yx(FWY)xxD motif